MDFRCGYVTIIGNTNVGKSTLLNRIIGEKVAIVSPKAQTSRDNTLGIYNDETTQIVFIDTPGYHKTEHKLDEYMQENIDNAINSDIDVLLYVIDAKKPLVEQYENLIKKGKVKGAKTILVINKIDETSFEKLYPELDKLNKVCSTDEILPLSALTGKNVDVLLEMIKKELPKFDYEMRYYPKEQFTDKNVRYLSAEIIREKILLLYNEEIPHGVAVQITQFIEEDNLTRISADIYCERDAHKMILIGKNGDAIKKLSTISRIAIEKMLDTKVYLELFVKVKENWRVDNLILSEFGYKNE